MVQIERHKREEKVKTIKRTFFYCCIKKYNKKQMKLAL